MIKSLFDEEENTEKKEKKATSEVPAEKHNSRQNSLSIIGNTEVDEEKKAENTLNEEIESVEEIRNAIVSESIFSEKNLEASKINYEPVVEPFEVDKPIGQGGIDRVAEQHSAEVKRPRASQETAKSVRATELEKQLQEIERELKIEKELETQRLNKDLVDKLEQQNEADIQKVQQLDEYGEVETVVIPKEEQTRWSDWEKEYTKSDTGDNSITIQRKEYISERKAETTRKMGMAWSAAIGLFGSVVFMLVLGWFIDLLLGTRPWGIVVGIIIGSIIGFMQFFRTTSRILKPNDFEKVSLVSNINAIENSKTEDRIENIDYKLDENIDSPIDKNIEEKEDENPVQASTIDLKKNEEEGETIVNIDS